MRIPVFAVLGLLLAAAAAPAQSAAELDQLYREVRALDTFARLGLSVDQATRLLPELQAIRQATAERAAADRTLYLDLSDAVVRVENDLLQNRPLDSDDLSTITAARQRHSRTVESINGRLQSAQNRVRQVLTNDQWALIEPEEHVALRLARMQESREGRRAGIAQMEQDLTTWARAVAADAYPTERNQRIAAILQMAYPGVEAAQLDPLRAPIAAYYDSVHSASPQAFRRIRGQFATRLPQLLPPPRLPAAWQQYVLTAGEWTEFLRDPVTYQMLDRFRALPGGAQ